MSVTEQQLISWSSPVGTSEDQKCKNAISQVTTAVRAKFGMDVSIFLQGSYRNNTNVKQDSDVDIVVRHDGHYFPNLIWLSEEQKRRFHEQNPDSAYSFSQFKSEVLQSLSLVFDNVQRKNKCLFIPGNTNRVNADVVPCFRMKRFRDENNVEAEGIQLKADDGTLINSFPEQHYNNGVAKRAATGQMYKKIVRIMKRIRNELIEEGVIPENLASSFLIECLIYNVPNNYFIAGQYMNSLRNVIAKLYNDLDDSAKRNEYVEVSELQYLFRGSNRSADNAKTFILSCWNYSGFK